ncbi:MAG: polysaccharide transporter, family [Caulobacteraceae bacterium]|nr:polysaccharide transporter, family [Caulobacteraceae bacterium]
MSASSIFGTGGRREAHRPVRLSMQALPLIVANSGRIAIQLALIPVLARIISPEAFGLVALAMPIIVFTSILAEAGLVTGLVRSHVSETAESTAFWFTAAVGVICAVAVCLIAGPTGWVARQIALPGILWALAPALFLTCLTIVPSARLQRTGNFGAFATGEMLSSLAGAAVALWSALHGWGAWSLVSQQLTLAGIRLVANIGLSRFFPRLVFDYGLLKPVLHLSTPLLGANLLAYLSRSLDNLLIGLCIGPKPLGFYATAYQVVQIPEYALGASVRTTALPAIARAASDRGAAADIYVNALRTMSLVATPVVIGCSLQADALVRLVLGPAWAPAAPLVAILAPLGLVHSYFQLNTAVLLGFGEARTQLRMSILTSVCGLVGIVAGFGWGPRGVALGYALGTLFAAGPYSLSVLRVLGASWRRLIGGVGRAWAAGAAMAVVLSAWDQHAGLHAQLLLGLPEAVLIGGGAYLVALLFLEQLRPTHRPRRPRPARLALGA